MAGPVLRLSVIHTLLPQDLTDTAGLRGRITIYCTAEAYDRKKLESSLRARQSRWLLQAYPGTRTLGFCCFVVVCMFQQNGNEGATRVALKDNPLCADVLYGQYWAPGLDEPKGDIFYFDYGVVAFWGLSAKEEQDVLDVRSGWLCAYEAAACVHYNT